ncbi:FAD-dependent oxidoreductase [Paraflavitalea speifideaquila]|uniref:FAD-dependent oxidoreductase n=1 Tax=Paraflavitalea speifideaquila TaxID=3076558 RepID=UPI0028EA37B4|nr:FAD-dependent oxidoreductase [Paraflavitalea speifideiaquila]
MDVIYERTAKKVVVIGGGFAGVYLIQQLAKDQRFQITLVDRNNYNFFPPLIYQVSAGFLEPSNISYPFRKLYHHKRMSLFVWANSCAYYRSSIR